MDKFNSSIIFGNKRNIIKIDYLKDGNEFYKIIQDLFDNLCEKINLNDEFKKRISFNNFIFENCSLDKNWIFSLNQIEKVLKKNKQVENIFRNLLKKKKDFDLFLKIDLNYKTNKQTNKIKIIDNKFKIFMIYKLKVNISDYIINNKKETKIIIQTYYEFENNLVFINNKDLIEYKNQKFKINELNINKFYNFTLLSLFFRLNNNLNFNY